jgi:3-phytase
MERYLLWGVLSIVWFSVASPVTAQVLVPATVETAPAPTSGDAADDPAIWVHPTDPAQSLIIGAIKNAGLAIYNMDGTQRQFIAVGRPNNVDVRYNFPLGGAPVDLVAFSDRATNNIGVYKVNHGTRMLENVAARTISLSHAIYGFCLYRSPRHPTNPTRPTYYAFITSETGLTEQWELWDNGGKVDGRFIRSFNVGSQTEGCVADDELARLYVGEENVGIWRYGAEPDDLSPRILIDRTGSGGHLTADVEGLSIYYGANGTGYLIASSQGSSTFVVYRREEPHQYVTTFAIGAGTGIDAVNGTDGIDVINVSLGPSFPMGAFVVQDDENDTGNQNFKLVPWQSIANAVNLTIDTAWNPRNTGTSGTNPPLELVDDELAVNEDEISPPFNVLGNDPDGSTLTLVSVTQPTHGVVTLGTGGNLTYRPHDNYHGPDAFTYTASDGAGGWGTATVSVTVSPVNDPPVAASKSVTTKVNTAVAITLQATDADGDTLTYSLYSSAAHGDLTWTLPNVLSYKPSSGYSGPDSFTFKASDGKSFSDAATVSISVTAATSGPIATETFESRSFTGGTGWLGAWTRSGDVSMRTNRDGPHGGTSHVRLRRSTGYLQRSVNLSGATSVILTFCAKVRSFEGSDRARVRVSPDGATFTTLMEFTSAHSNNSYRCYNNLSLAGFPMTSNFRIAFDADMSSDGDEWFLDDIQVTGVR